MLYHTSDMLLYFMCTQMAIEEQCEEERYRSLVLEEDFVDPEKDQGKEGVTIAFCYDDDDQHSQNLTSALAPTTFPSQVYSDSCAQLAVS